MNLLAERVRASLRPGGRITVGLRAQRRIRGHLRFRHREREYPPKIAAKYFSFSSPRGPGAPASDLANTFRFVQLHNGRIEFESEVGRGTTFRVELPLARMEAVQAGQARRIYATSCDRETVECPAVIKRQTVTAGMPGGGLYSPAASAFPRRAARSSMFMRRRLSPRPPFRHPRRPSAP